MSENYTIGNVFSIDGLKINILMNEHSNLETFHYNGTIYDGVSIGSYVGIIRGSHKIIGRVEKEFLEDKSKDFASQEFSRNRFQRFLEISLIGNIYNGHFEFGIKILPMIFNEVILLTQKEVRTILQNDASTSEYTISVGKNIANDLLIEIAWNKLFNTHIGIFGNTGSGKSNTLTKIYTELFKQEDNKIGTNFNDRSQFFIIDFNGEYLKEDIFRKNKKCLNLSTRGESEQKLPLTPQTFWDIETLSILYSATEKTQKPFLSRAVNFYLDKETNDITSEKIIAALGLSFYNIFKQNNNKDTLNLLHKSLSIISFNTSEKYCDSNGQELDLSWLNYLWHSKIGTYYLDDSYISNMKDETISEKMDDFKEILNSNFICKINSLTATQKIQIIANSQLIYYLSYGKVNFEHINPLIQRIEARSNFIEKTIEITKENKNENLLTIISLRNCNSEAKKMIPLLIAKQLYNEHKEKLTDTEITNTAHLIIDEAHNILSSQSIREEESWKDYRLEVFEEIIKEGRKFGFFLTLASQRPADISPTIMSQIHNYFIHRLVNEQDLRMIANTVNSLDAVSRSRIPSLAPGQCVITGTSFEMPLLVQITKLEKQKSPTSDNADLIELWTKTKEVSVSSNDIPF